MTRRLGSAAYRIALVYSGVFALAIAALGLIVFLIAHEAFVRQLDARVETSAADLLTSFREEGFGELREAIVQREAGGSLDELGYALFSPGGRRIAGSLDATMPDLGWSNIVFVDPREGDDPARALTTELPDGKRLVVAADREPLEAIDRTILRLFLVVFTLVILIGIAGAFLLGAYLRRRLGRLASAADRIVSGALGERMPVGPADDEFDRLSHSLNVMLDRIAALLDNLRQVSGDIAHDLRTPLTRLRNELEAAAGSGGDRPVRRATIEKAVEQVDEILVLFAAILRISEVEGGRIRRSFKPVDLSALARELYESYAPAAEDGGRSLMASIEEGLVVEGDRELLAQAIINLLDNALLHTPVGARIALDFLREEGRAILRVKDNGPGIPEKDADRVLKRFTRLETSRSKAGHGLGLSLVAAIANLHGAELALKDNDPGLTVRMAFQERKLSALTSHNDIIGIRARIH